MNQVGGWSTYTGSDIIVLTAILLFLAGIFTYLGSRLQRPIEPKRPGFYIGFTLAAIWLLAWLAFLTAAVTYGQALIQQIGQYTPPKNPITPITLTSALVTFLVVSFLARRSGGNIATGSGLVAAIAAPMIFELPFSLIVMGRTYPPTPAVQYTLLYFMPLFIVSLSAYALTTLSPIMRLSRYTLFSLAGMFLVFGVWALFGFSYPAGPIPIMCNAVAKILSFITAITLFLPLKGVVEVENVSRETSQTV